MSKKITKEIPVIAAINEVAWYAQEKDTLGDLSVQARYALKKNMRALEQIDTDFREFKDSLEKELYDEFLTDEKSDETEIEDKNGNKQIGRQVKEEFLEDYQAKLEEVNGKLQELLVENESVDLYVIDMDAEIEAMPRDAQISDATMDMMSLFEGEDE